MLVHALPCPAAHVIVVCACCCCKISVPNRFSCCKFVCQMRFLCSDEVNGTLC
jgi:hypothetical protein